MLAISWTQSTHLSHSPSLHFAPKAVLLLSLCRDTFHMSAPRGRQCASTYRGIKREDMQAMNQKQQSPSNWHYQLYDSPSPCAHKQARLHPGTAVVPTSKMLKQMLSSLAAVNICPTEFPPAPVVPYWRWKCTTCISYTYYCFLPPWPKLLNPSWLTLIKLQHILLPSYAPLHIWKVTSATCHAFSWVGS